MKKKIPETIRISEKTARRLMLRGRFNETFDDLISRVLDEIEEYEKEKK
jgi:hypothetical protein